MIYREAEYATERRIALREAVRKTAVWNPPTKTTTQLSRVRSVVEVNNYKGDVLKTTATVRPVPKAALSADGQNIILSSGPIAVAGSFAPTIDDAGFNYISTTTGFTLYFDGTNGSRRIVRRRVDGFREPLPPGTLTVTGLTPGSVGGPAPIYKLIPFCIPGACHLGFVKGDLGSPQFCHNDVTNDELQQARIRGREPIMETFMEIQLAAVPIPTPDPTDPPDSPQPPVAGSNLTIATQAPAPNSQVLQTVTVKASGTATGFPIRRWAIYVDADPTIWSVDANVSSIAPTIQFPYLGAHTITIRLWNTNNDFIEAHIPVNFYVPSAPPPPTYEPPVRPPCVMLGTEIVPLGVAEWWTEEMPQHEWYRLFTYNQRELMAVPTHRIYTSRAGLTEMRDVRKGDKIVTAVGEDIVVDIRPFNRPGVKVCVHMKAGHLYWANGILSHNVKVYTT